MYMPVERICCHLLQGPIPVLIPQGSTTGLRRAPGTRLQLCRDGPQRYECQLSDVLTKPLSITTDVCLHVVEHLLGTQTEQWVMSTADTGFRWKNEVRGQEEEMKMLMWWQSVLIRVRQEAHHKGGQPSKNPLVYCWRLETWWAVWHLNSK